MKLFVTGREGQVARSLSEAAKRRPDIELILGARPEIDLETPGSVASAIAALAPDVVINAAAYTAVDNAEENEALAMRINADAAGEVAAAATAVGARMIQISTDYVFDGSWVGPYAEDRPVAPLGAYGRSKLAGEERVRSACPDHAIVRSAWVYSPFGTNFVRTMLRLGADRDEIRVVADQRGSPTSALDLAEGLFFIVDRWAEGKGAIGATFHLAGTGQADWAELASAIFAASARRGGPSARVVPISTADYPTPAKRPRNSVLDSRKFSEVFGFQMPDWRASLDTVVGRLVGLDH